MTVTFDYWTDPLCIWAYVAQPKLDHLHERFGDQIAVRTRIVPVFGSVPHRLRSGSWALKGVEGRVAVTARVAREHGPEGCNVDGTVWRTDCPTSSWAAGMAAKGVGLLEERGDIGPRGMSGYLVEMRRRFFEENLNVARRDAQLALAADLGIDPDALAATLDDGSALAALFEDHQDREQQRVQGSPTYVFDGGRTMIYGNFDASVLEATVEAYVKGQQPGGSLC